MLSTDLWNMKYIIKNIIKSRAPIGNASDISLISKNCAEWLKLTVFSTNHRLVVLNSISLEICLCFNEFNFYLCFANNYSFLYVFVVNQVKTHLFNFWLEIQTSQKTVVLPLADLDSILPNKLKLDLMYSLISHWCRIFIIYL